MSGQLLSAAASAAAVLDYFVEIMPAGLNNCILCLTFDLLSTTNLLTLVFYLVNMNVSSSH